MSRRPRVDDSCCVQPSRTKWQWKNKALMYPIEWREYVNGFLRDYKELDASSIKDKREFLKKYFVFDLAKLISAFVLNYLVDD